MAISELKVLFKSKSQTSENDEIHFEWQNKETKTEQKQSALYCICWSEAVYEVIAQKLVMNYFKV